MWCLLGWAQRHGKGYIKRPTPKDDNSVFARRARDRCLGLDKTDNTATILVAHAALPCIFELRRYELMPRAESPSSHSDDRLLQLRIGWILVRQPLECLLYQSIVRSLTLPR